MRSCDKSVHKQNPHYRMHQDTMNVNTEAGEKDATHPLFGQGVRNGLEGSLPRERGCALPPRPGRASRPAGEFSGRSRPD